MPLIASDTGGTDLPPCPAGVHAGVCDLVADMGMIRNKQSGKDQRKVFVRWQIPSERVSWENKTTGEIHEGPSRIGNRYTVSLSERAILYRDLVNWRGRPFTPDELKGFDVFTVLGAACLLQVTHQPDKQRPGKVFANISAIMRLPKGYDVPIAEPPLVKYAFDEPEMFDLLPKWLQNHINMQQQAAATPSFGDQADDPFVQAARARAALTDPNDPNNPNYVARGSAIPRKPSEFDPPAKKPAADITQQLTPEQLQAAAAAYLAAKNGEAPSPRSLQQAVHSSGRADPSDPDAWRDSDDVDLEDDIPF